MILRIPFPFFNCLSDETAAPAHSSRHTYVLQYPFLFPTVRNNEEALYFAS